MRPKNSTLTAPQVHRCAAVVLQDHLKLGDHGPKCRASLLFTLLLYAAARITSLSDACKTLRRPLRRGRTLGPHRHLARFCRIAPPAQRRLGRQLAQNLAPQSNMGISRRTAAGVRFHRRRVSILFDRNPTEGRSGLIQDSQELCHDRAGILKTLACIEMLYNSDTVGLE